MTMKRYVAMTIYGAVVALAILGIEGMAEADIVIYVKDGNKAVPVKVTKYSEFRRVVYVYLPSGASKKLPKSKICAIVNDGEGGYARILNRCAFTPQQLAKIQKAREEASRRGGAISQAMRKEREAREARNRRKQEAEARARREAEETKLRLRAYTSLWIQVYASSEKGLVWTHPPGDSLFSSVAVCRRRGEALMVKRVVYFAPRTYPVYDVNCLPADDIPYPFVINEDLGWK